jgi:hypothetical protein
LTHSTSIEQPEDGAAVDESQQGPVPGEPGGAVPCLDAIQHRYEEAKASIVDPARSLSCSATCEDALPGTEAIDLATLPPVPPAETPGTEGMSVAARFLAERMVEEEARGTSSGPAEDAVPRTSFEGNFAADSAWQRRWWRRAARHRGGVGRR